MGCDHGVLDGSILIGGRERSGPSYCTFDFFITPVELIAVALAIHHRIGYLVKLPPASGSPWEELQLSNRIQFAFALLLVAHPMISLLQFSSTDEDTSGTTFKNLLLVLMWGGNIAVMVLETYRKQPRGPHLKWFWICDVFIRMFSLRLAILHWSFETEEVESETSDSRAAADFFGFVLSFCIMTAGILERPSPQQASATAYGQFQDEDEAAVGDGKEKEARPTEGEAFASWASLFSFAWITHLLTLGKEKQLSDDDLHRLLKTDTSHACGERVLAEWREELKSSSPSLLRALRRVHLLQFIESAALKLVNDTVVFIGPLLLQSLIQYVEDSADPDRKQHVMDGAMLAFGMFIAKTVESLALGQYFHVGYRIGGQVRASMTMMVYRKAFLLSSKGRQGYKLGELVSLMSVDAQRLCMAAPYLHLIWSAPLQLTVCTVLLYNIVGASVFGGMMLMVLLIPANTYIAKKQTQLNREIMQIKDERSNTMDEVLQGIRIIKYFAWEGSFVDKVQEIRDREVALIWKNSMWGIMSMFLWGGSPMLVALITFLIYTGSGTELRPNIAFTALALFNVMRFPLNTIAIIINIIVESHTALGRLQAYFLADDIDRNYYLNCDTSLAAADGVEMSRVDQEGDVAVEIAGGTFSWPKPTEPPPEEPKETGLMKLFSSKKAKTKLDWEKALQDFNVVLRGIDLSIQKGELVGVCGKVGAGKTSLMSAILGDLRKDAGTVMVTGKMAYAAQQPWIINATLRDNVTFGAEFDEERYSAVLAACALIPDLDVLPGGDLTEIGEKGINLSGGQKARISLARAVYQDADVYLLDDPLSAVDVHVSKHLFEECIMTYLAEKTIILVTHQIQYLPECDHVIVLEDSSIAAEGSFEEVSAKQPHLCGANDTSGGRRTAESSPLAANREASPAATMEGNPPPGSPLSRRDRKRSRRLSSTMLKQTNSSHSFSDKFGGKTTTLEVRKAGTVPLKVWLAYANSLGHAMVGLVLLAYFGSQCLQLGSDWWLSVWSTAAVERDKLLAEGDAEEPPPVPTAWYLGMYAVITILACISVVVRGAVVAVAVIRSAVVLHNRMLESVLRAPVRFFDTTPTGRVLNRFSSDQYTLDNELRTNLSMVLMCTIKVFFVGITILWVTPLFAIIVLPLAFVYLRVQSFYRQSSREMKRLESVSQSPIFAHFSETLNGVSTIRAFGAQHNFHFASQRLNDVFSRAYFDNNAANRWLGIRLELIGNIAVGAAALFAVVQNGNDPSTAGLVGLSITYALEVTGTLNWAIRTFTQLESYMVAVERIEEYSSMDREACAVVEANRPPPSWPNQGRLTFDMVVMRYRPDLEPALKGITFSTGPGEKIGVVGRTGAGKSSLAVALFRIVELSSGRVELDGIDVAKIGLDDLRKQLSIIPQDPVLFSGTIRSNLDPFKDYTNQMIWEALEKVKMKEYIDTTDQKLDHGVEEGGSNLSVGQRQLLCMARALLRKAKVIVMDEATASVDMQTDSAIQETIREQFQSSTVLTIAHRLATVMACDKVMVLGEGTVLEMGSPQQLMEDTTSTFHIMTSDHSAAQDMLN